MDDSSLFQFTEPPSTEKIRASNVDASAMGSSSNSSSTTSSGRLASTMHLAQINGAFYNPNVYMTNPFPVEYMHQIQRVQQLQHLQHQQRQHQLKQQHQAMQHHAYATIPDKDWSQVASRRGFESTPLPTMKTKSDVDVDTDSMMDEAAPARRGGSGGNGRKNRGGTYATIIADAILSTPEKKAQLSTIVTYFVDTYPDEFDRTDTRWQNSVRHNLSLQECFIKLSVGSNSSTGKKNEKGCFWTIHPAWIMDGKFVRPTKPKRNRLGGLVAARISPPASSIPQDMQEHGFEYGVTAPPAMSQMFTDVNTRRSLGSQQQYHTPDIALTSPAITSSFSFAVANTDPYNGRTLSHSQMYTSHPATCNISPFASQPSPRYPISSGSNHTSSLMGALPRNPRSYEFKRSSPAGFCNPAELPQLSRQQNEAWSNHSSAGMLSDALGSESFTESGLPISMQKLSTDSDLKFPPLPAANLMGTFEPELQQLQNPQGQGPSVCLGEDEDWKTQDESGSTSPTTQTSSNPATTKSSTCSSPNSSSSCDPAKISGYSTAVATNDTSPATKLQTTTEVLKSPPSGPTLPPPSTSLSTSSTASRSTTSVPSSPHPTMTHRFLTTSTLSSPLLARSDQPFLHHHRSSSTPNDPMLFPHNGYSSLRITPIMSPAIGNVRLPMPGSPGLRSGSSSGGGASQIHSTVGTPKQGERTLPSLKALFPVPLS
ncbi:Hepatocyte nuclear factor 3-beta [Phlyctochytrium planicorne]|nr:Hepatocyte nuclear factor 3-beta [Phlyctochytrium planicorne]